MKKIKPFFKRHPVLIFYALTFVISWCGMLLVLGLDVSQADNEKIGRLMALVYAALLVGPSVAAILLTALLEGKEGLRRYRSRLLKWRVGPRWYAVALLSAPLAAMAVLYALSLTSRDYLPRIATTDDRAFLVQFSILSALIVGIFIELGWTGFAVPKLSARYGIAWTGLIVGLLWGAWQSFVVYWGGGDSPGTLPPAFFFPAVLFTWLPSFRVLMTWVYDRTESLLVAILMHVSFVATWTMCTPLTITGWALLVYYLAFSAALWVMIAAVAVANGGHLSPRPPRRRMA
jgi:membrane protease YdiL (CAAX protease family)